MEELDQIVGDAPGRVSAAESLAELDSIESELIGRQSKLAEIQRGVGNLPNEDKPRVGRALKEARNTVSSAIARRRQQLDRMAADALLEDDRVDMTLEAYGFRRGSLHLIQQTIDEITDIFVALGYAVADGPEAELTALNFDALNTPPTHPARAESDTMYLDYGEGDSVLLRTQTSPMQVRWMQDHRPPVHVIVPGKVYRSDTIDASHLPVFHQIEGLAVDTGITFADLKGTLAHFAREFLGPQTKVRLRPHFFPFTEPSAELDASCFNCDGGEPDCRVCRGSGWVELAGCGMVDPNVFSYVDYDPDEVTGFAFGVGVERTAMARYGINNIRHFVENDIRFLEQF